MSTADLLAEVQKERDALLEALNLYMHADQLRLEGLSEPEGFADAWRAGRKALSLAPLPKAPAQAEKKKGGNDAQHIIYKHRFVVMVLSESRLKALPLIDLDHSITQGPNLGWVSLESREEITDRERIVQECVALYNDGEFFTALWDELEE